MRKHVSWLIAISMVVGAVCLMLSPTWTSECLAALGVSALEKEVARADVPEPVMAMILKEAKGNEIEDVEVSDHGHVKVYEADWDAGEGHVEVRVMYLCRLVGRTFENPAFDDDEDGDDEDEGDDDDDEWGEVRERAVSFNQVPAAVRDAFAKAAGKSMVREIEEIVTKKGTFYEAEWIVEGWEIDLLLTAEGKMVRKEMELIWDDDDDEDDDDDGDDEDDDDDDDDEDDDGGDEDDDDDDDDE